MDEFNVDLWAKSIDHEVSLVKRLRKEIKKLCRKIEQQQTTAHLLNTAVKEAMRGIKAIKPSGKAVKKKTRPVEAWLYLSDWQVGKVTTSYNSKIAIKRIHKLTEEVKRYLKNEKPKVLHIILQGDMVEGEAIFPGQPFEIDSDLWTQALRTVPELIAYVVTELSPLVPKIKVAAVHGNHGRSGTKHTGHSRRSNWDIVSYETAKLLCDASGLKNVVWDISTHWYVIQQVAGNGILCVHGDQIRGGGPIPLANIFKKAQGWQLNIKDWNFLSVGHHHTHASGVLNNDLYFFLSGSPESDNEFAKECLAQGGAPVQRLCFFDKQGLISENLIRL